MKDRALVVAPLPACRCVYARCVGEGRDEVRGEGWNGLHFVLTACSRNCRDLNCTRRGEKDHAVNARAPRAERSLRRRLLFELRSLPLPGRRLGV